MPAFFVMLLVLSFAIPAFPRDAGKDRAEINARIDALQKELFEMSDWMYYNPEPGFKEFKAVKLLTDYLRKYGFDSETGVAGLETAFKAHYRKNNGAPHLGFIVEYDALRGKDGGAFHGDEHNMQGPAGIGAAIALAEFMTKNNLPGSIYVIGTPAEEIAPPAKYLMWQKGVFNGLDFITRSHGSGVTRRASAGFGSCCLNINAVRFTFTGRPAHASGDPWNGRSALDAVLSLFHSIDMLREHVRPESRLHGVITQGGEAPNVVPEKAVTEWFFRHPDRAYLDEVTERIFKAAQGAAMATGTEVQIEDQGKYFDGISLESLHELAFAYATKYGATNIREEKERPSGYDETGIISQNIPGVGVTVQSKPEDAPGHSHEMAKASIEPIGHTGLILASKVMASVMYDLLGDESLRTKVREEHARWKVKLQNRR